MKKTRAIKILVTSCIILLLAVGAAAVGGKWFGATKRTKADKTEIFETVNVMDESTAGAPTGDDPWLEMEKLINAYYSTVQRVTYTGKMLLMDDNEEKEKLLEELNFEYSSCKGDYYYRLGQIECVKKDSYILLVDHDSRTVGISPVTKGGESNAGMLSMEEFKKALEQRSSDIKVTQSGSDKILTVNNIQDPTIQGYQVYYDRVTYQLKKMLIGMIRLSPLFGDGRQETIISEKSETDLAEKDDADAAEVEGYAYRLEIIYDKTERVPLNKEGFVPEQKFIRFKAGKPELQPAFAGYKLLN